AAVEEAIGRPGRDRSVTVVDLRSGHALYGRARTHLMLEPFRAELPSLSEASCALNPVQLECAVHSPAALVNHPPVIWHQGVGQAVRRRVCRVEPPKAVQRPIEDARLALLVSRMEDVREVLLGHQQAAGLPDVFERAAADGKELHLRSEIVTGRELAGSRRLVID